jgi:glycine cleavage system aminomethyltransferase T
LIIYKMKEEQYLLVVNASNIDKDWDWFRHKMIWVSRWNLSDDTLSNSRTKSSWSNAGLIFID